MIDSIKLQEIVDVVKSKRAAIHPMVRKIHDPTWGIVLFNISQTYAYLYLQMSFSIYSMKSDRRFRYKWFQRIVDMLNSEAKGEIVFLPQTGDFECRFVDGALEGSLNIHAYNKGDWEALQRIHQQIEEQYDWKETDGGLTPPEDDLRDYPLPPGL